MMVAIPYKLSYQISNQFDNFLSKRAVMKQYLLSIDVGTTGTVVPLDDVGDTLCRGASAESQRGMCSAVSKAV